MNRDVKLLAEACASHESPGVRAAAKRILAPKRRPSLPRHGAVAKASERKQAKREERRERAATIRAAVFGRAGGKCEWCWDWFTDLRPGEWHHLLGGGLRRKREAEDTTAAICVPCHRGWERADEEVLGKAAVWAEEQGFMAALAAVQRRHAKVIEARTAGER